MSPRVFEGVFLRLATLGQFGGGQKGYRKDRGDDKNILLVHFRGKNPSLVVDRSMSI